jgi:acetoin:2,6-dichlorophenolindophenol oxidoreductase subunit alpha
MVNNKMNSSTKNSKHAEVDLRDKMESSGLSADHLIEMYTKMCQIRQFEVMADRLYAQGKVHGTMHLSAGQEAVAAGVWSAVRHDAYFLNHHRGHGHFIARGSDINLMMAEFLGKDSGYCHGRGGSMHIADIETNNLGANGIVGGGLSLVAGVGLALKLQEINNLAVVIFGDGAANEGIFHESLNMAALWSLPILYICENNHYGMSMEVSRATAKLPIAQRADVYGIPWKYIDGNDVLLVYETIKQAATHIQSGNGPYFVEAETYRYFGHSKSDRNLYRTRDEIDNWKRRDPILLFRQQLVTSGIITEQAAEEIDQQALKLIEAAVNFAESSLEPDLSSLLEFVYA